MGRGINIFTRVFTFAVAVCWMAGSASAIVISTGSQSDYLSPFNAMVGNGVTANGVVLVSIGNAGCSGSLISPDQVLTAGHCIVGSGGSVSFLGASGTVTVPIASAVVDPQYTSSGGDSTKGNDLAVVTLSSNAPSFATVYSIYTGSYTFGTTVELVGYGETGTGITGAQGGTFGTRYQGSNDYVETGAVLGYSSNILVGRFLNPATGLAVANEVDIAPGDSGGPSFFDGQIIGVHDFLICSAAPCDSKYGELFGDTSVGAAANFSFIEGQIAPEPSTVATVGFVCLALAAFRTRKASRILRMMCSLFGHSHRDAKAIPL